MEFHPFVAHGIAPECGASDIRYSDQQTHGIAPECGIHLPRIQSKSLWHLTEKGNKLKFHYIFEITKNELQ